MRSQEPSSSMARRLVALAGSIAIAASVFVATPLRVHATSNGCDVVDMTSPSALTVHMTVTGCGDGTTTSASQSYTARLYQGSSPYEIFTKEDTGVSVPVLLDQDLAVPAYGQYTLEVEYWNPNDGASMVVIGPITVAAGPLVTITQPFLTYRVGQIAGSTFPASLVWTNTSPNKATSYRVYRSIDGNVSFALLATIPVTTTTGAPGYKYSYPVTVNPGHYWQYKVVAVNGSGAGPEQISRKDYARAYANQNSSTNFTYKGTWAGASLLNYWGGSTKASKIAGSSVTFTFTGTVAAIVMATGPTRGSFKVYTYESGTWRLWRTISTYSGVNGYRKTLWSIRWPEPGTRAIRVVVVGTAGHPRVDIDGFMTLE